LMAGINAHLKGQGEKPFILKRNEAYIGVLIDDLISKGTQEPYRMFTSRAEFRTLLRQDNADIRLTEMSYRIGLASQKRMDQVLQKNNDVESIKEIFKNNSLEPTEINEFFTAVKSSTISEKQKLDKVLLRPNLGVYDLINHVPKVKNILTGFSNEAIEQAEIQTKYQVYIEKEKELVEKMRLMEDLEIPESFDYQRITSLGVEAKEKLIKRRPRTLGQASRISGINPTDVQILMVYMGR
ncbi:MAG: tRNA uridine-5-carboxymethylaminomethyl(34) synthesis enzyme MnmG, partial [Bacteroidota bacterium]|nr:tRNA uridine-5-carboxymethylaminomethyl(34) synthesis enzyme MnmG [Bacteroidota bacterium]